MPITLTVYRVVLAGPSDVDKEINRIKMNTRSLSNTYFSKKIGYYTYDWKMSAPKFHIHGPQGVIDKDMKINRSDIFICVFKKRYGTSIKNSKSGTEHELNRAIKSWKKTSRPQIKMYFKKINDKERQLLKGNDKKQYENVLNLKKRMEKMALYFPFHSENDLSNKIYEHLNEYLLERITNAGNKKRRKTKIKLNKTNIKRSSFIDENSKIKNKIETSFTFHKLDTDDHHFAELLDFMQYRYEISAKPIKRGYWRCGLKFSENKNFSTDRYASGYPLVHLLHNVTSEEDSTLRLMYYDNYARKVINLEPILMNYSDQEILIRLTPSAGKIQIDISVLGNHLRSFQIGNYKFCQFFCWWDRELNVPIKARVIKINHSVI